MTGDSLYETALVAALGVISKLEAKPLMPRQEKLATVTHDVLEAIRLVVEQVRSGGSKLPVPDRAELAMRLRCYLVPNGELPAANGRRSSPALPPPR